MKQKSVVFLLILAVIIILVGGYFLSPQAFRPAEETEESQPEINIEKYCSDPDVAGVYSCQDDTIKVVSKLLGGGSKYIKPDGSETHCPIVNPEEVSEECKNLSQLDCPEKLCGIKPADQENMLGDEKRKG